MKVLIIGNGFDLANNLPTRYPDFLHICELVRSKYIYTTRDGWKYSFPYKEDNELCDSLYRELNDGYFREFIQLAKHNVFVTHFLERRSLLGDKWLNFEEEIERFIGIIVSDMHSAKNEKYNGTAIQALDNHIRQESLKVNTFKDLFAIVRKEHLGLARILEIYMDGYINNLDITRISRFKKGYYDKVIVI